MTETADNVAGRDQGAAPPAGIRSILLWLELPLAPNPADELPSLRSHLKALHDLEGTPQQRARALDGLYQRSRVVIASLLPALGSELVLPVPRKERRVVRSILELLQMFADDSLELLDSMGHQQTPEPAQAAELALWRVLDALAQQLMISHLIASPARAGAWQQLHQSYAMARSLHLQTSVPPGVPRSLQDVYHSAVLLGCAQPASMAPRELLFLAAYFERFADQTDPLPANTGNTAGAFWIDPARDAPALSSLRKSPRPAAPLDGFSCLRLCRLLRTQTAELDSGTPPQEINLPDFAATPSGRGVLQRLLLRWSDSGKRRFQRRRQNHRALLAAGIDGIWKLSKKGVAADVDLSTWMITNESPEGYAVMHVAGKTGALTVGDVVTVRTGSDENWQICLVRWAVSENPEHLELGLQILAPRAVPAILAQPSPGEGTEHLRVLILPEIPKLRSSQSLVVASGAVPRQRRKLILVIEDGNIVVREVNSVGIDEQTGSVEILSIEPDHYPV